MASYLPFYLSPDHATLGMGTIRGQPLWGIGLGMAMFNGTAAIWHLYALLSIASGLYTSEEWPRLFHKPYLATSLSELWGKRYHQLLRVSHLNYPLIEYWLTMDRTCS